MSLTVAWQEAYGYVRFEVRDAPAGYTVKRVATGATNLIPIPGFEDSVLPVIGALRYSRSHVTAGFVVRASEFDVPFLRHALERCHGNRSLTATQLGIGRTTLYRKLKEYGLLTTDDAR